MHTLVCQFAIVLEELYKKFWHLLHLLVILSAPVFVYADRYEDTELIDAAGRGDLKSMRDMMTLGASVNAQNRQGETALMRAAANGKLESISVLVEAGAKIDVRDKYGSTALIKAARFRRSAVVSKLIAAGADVNARNFRGQTALIWAVQSGDYESAKALVQHNADVNAETENPKLKNKKETALDIATRQHKTRFIILLKSARDKNGKVKNQEN